MHLTILLFLIISVSSGPVLDNIPITFEMTGSTTYSPDKGGASQTGYRLKIGYSYKQWLGIEFVTSVNQNDVLIMQLDDFYTTGSNSFFTGHEVFVDDYYETSGSLNVDQNTDKDISAYSYVEKKHYEIDLIRYTGSNSNEDWNGAANQYSLTQVCFYTSDQIFSASSWNSYLKQCYFFEIDNYVSTFKGVFLKSFFLNGYSTGIYGWIDGPYVTDNVYFYHTTPLFSYTENPAFAI